MFSFNVFQQQPNRQEIHNAFNTRATKGPSLIEYESVLDKFMEKIYIQDGWNYRNLGNIVQNLVQAQGNQEDMNVDFREYAVGRRKPTRESIIARYTISSLLSR